MDIWFSCAGNASELQSSLWQFHFFQKFILRCSTAGYKWDWEGNLSAEYWSLIVHGHCYKKYDITKTNFILMFNWKLLVIFLQANGRWKDNLCFESFLSCLCYFGGQTYLPLCGGSRQNIGVKTAAAPPPDLEHQRGVSNLWNNVFTAQIHRYNSNRKGT